MGFSRLAKEAEGYRRLIKTPDQISERRREAVFLFLVWGRIKII